MTLPYPLIFEPILLGKVWGGRSLHRLDKPLPAGQDIGECWELADLAVTSAGGAGGQPVHSRIANGELKGRTIRDAIAAWGRQLLGGAAAARDGGFPLLVKFLDARENLSVQVHPSPAYAAAHPEAHLKTECWYIVDAEPGAKIYKGIRPGVTPETFRRHLADGGVVDDLIAVPAIPGECHTLPSGTCHALGAGVLVAEVQTASDTTFRVYDWGRSGRELHVEPALACIDFAPAPPATRLASGVRVARLVKNEFFTVDECDVRTGECEPAGLDSNCSVVMVLSGEGELLAPANAPGVRLRRGQTALIPAAIAGSTAFKAASPARLLRVGL